MQSVRKPVLAVLLFIYVLNSSAQDFMMQGFYWNYPNLFGIQTYGKNLRLKVPDLAQTGFTFLWLPPLSRSANDQASIGYDVQDYFDVGEYGLGATRFGTRHDVNNIISTLEQNGMHAVGDLIYNHRAGGKTEVNTAVQGWIENMNSTKINNGDQPYPSDRFQCFIVLGDSNHNGAGNYYFKFRSASQSANFYNKPYTVAMWTSRVPLFQDTFHFLTEVEPNGGSNCSEPDNNISLGWYMNAHVDNSGCGIDEFKLTLDTSMFRTTGDTLFVSMGNTKAKNLGDFSDHYIYGLWYDSAHADIEQQVQFQTYTDFTHMPSGKGAMNHLNFRPNGAPTCLCGDQEEMLFFYDVDQNVHSSDSVQKDFTRWMFDTIGVKGMRLDAVKQYAPAYVGSMLDYLHNNNINPKMVVGESYDYNPSVLTGWVNAVQGSMAQSTRDSIQVRVFDFALRLALKNACDAFGNDVRNVFNSGIVDGAGGSGFNSVTFINNHDFRDPGQPVTNNPELAYAYILTNNKLGVPCVFYNDYYNSNLLKGNIKGLMKAHKRYIFGSTNVDYLTSFTSSYNSTYVKGFNTTTLIYQLHNPALNQEVVMAINFAGDTLDVYQKINVTNVAVGDTFTNIFGVGPDTLLTVNANQELHVRIPPRSFACFVKGVYKDSLFSLYDTLAVSAIEEPMFGANSIYVYPNPFTKGFTIELNKELSSSTDLELFDLAGKQLYQEQLNDFGSTLFNINPPVTNAGIYVLRLSNKEAVTYLKLVKE